MYLAGTIEKLHIFDSKKQSARISPLSVAIRLQRPSCFSRPELVQPARAGSAGRFLLRLYIKCQKTSTPGQQKRHSAECSEMQRNQCRLDCFAGMLLSFLSQWWYQIGRQPVRCRLKTAYRSAHWENPIQRAVRKLTSPPISSVAWLVQPVDPTAGWLAGSASQLVGWFSQSKVQFYGEPH